MNLIIDTNIDTKKRVDYFTKDTQLSASKIFLSFKKLFFCFV